MIEIDGSFGEGGGQILRSSLALATLTGQPVRIDRVRAGRAKPGLLRQHLAAVQAAARVSNGRVEGASLGSTRVELDPGPVTGGTFHFSIGSAGSAPLVLSTVLPALALADEPSVVTVEGGTHNPLAPTVDFLRASLLPLLARMGVEVRLTLERHGFYPKGGGRLRAEITPGVFGPLDLVTLGAQQWRRATATVADLPRHVARRELDTLVMKLGLGPGDLVEDVLPHGRGPGNVCRVELQHEHATIVFTEHGKKGLPAETVAAKLADQVRRFERAGVAIDEHLADQLLLPMAIGEGGRFTTLAPSSHTRTQAQLIEQFLGAGVVEMTELGKDRWLVEVRER
ncbi:MAG: RNA 3'-terminal phosphate cyclase [Myxococcales bacterium]|nr:RNA 3'-terminal phosphate cyclase [Myxococcales bacterium]